MTLNKAIAHLREEYIRALWNPTVRTPLAYALYHTWRYVDAKEEKDKTKGNKDDGRNGTV